MSSSYCGMPKVCIKVLHSIFIGYYRSLRKLVLILCKSVEHFNETKHQSLKLLTQSKYKKEWLNEIKKKPEWR